MWDNIQYGLLYSWVKMHALLPMPVLYLFADIFYYLIYYVVRYRVRVVRRNMKASFPDKSPAELRQLEKEFYRHFADYVIESIKLAHISTEELQRRAWLSNPEMIDKLMDEGHTCVIMVLGHYGNWEWLSGTSTRFKSARIYQIYRPLNSPAVDRLFINLRTKFASLGIKKNNTIRDIIQLKQDKTHAVVVFLADQTPSKANLHYWTNFLNQDSAILTGPERIARKLNLPVVFADVQKTGRGYYTVDFQLITDTPKATAEFQITEQYARMMEKSILRNPAYWLWTHKRWKHKHETANNQ